ncbi:MAG: macro domain-containing protein [Gemmatimonadota bacterium]|nr:macro domain-containing protein [Gemmatimonadota bacterium]
MITVVRAPIQELAVEAVVRPIRTDLGPVSSASRDLWTAAGAGVHDHLDRLESLPLGGAVMTPAGDLACDFLIHAVVMSEDEPQTPATVQRALRNSLGRAADWGVESLALPPLGLGVGLAEPEESARALLEVLFEHVAAGAPPQDLRVVVTSAFESDIFERLITMGDTREQT